METSPHIIAIRFYAIAVALVVGGLGLGGLIVGRLDDTLVVLSIDTGVLVCALCGYFLLRAVSRARLRAPVAIALFVVSAIDSFLVAPLPVLACRALWPHLFRGEQELNFLAAPTLALLVSLALLVFFLPSLFSCRNPQANPRT
jgi:hypothetical protein